jgi:Putative prokaryotic signal transducing protein
MSDAPDEESSDVSKDSPAAHPVKTTHALDYASQMPLRLVTLCRMRLVEADLAKAKLESEGIECIIRDSRLAIAEPLLLTDVPLLVRDTDVEKARAILARPAPDAMDGEYVQEAWRCPQCHRRNVDLLPLSQGWRQTRTGCLTILALPVFLGLIQAIAGKSNLRTMIENAIGAFALVWAVIVIVLSLAVMFAKRRKRCRDCGHEWTDAPSQAGE